MVTLDHVAQRAKLSKSSISKILSGHTGFSQETRGRVTRLAHEMNYQPSGLGRALAGGSSMTIGILWSGLSVPVSMSRVHMLEKQAAAAGYLPYLLSPSVDDVPAQLRSISSLKERRVDGLIYHMSTVTDARVIKTLQGLNIPVVYVDRVPPDLTSVVAINREKCLHTLAEHLQSLGHKRAGIFITPSDAHDRSLKADLYQQALATCSISLDKQDQYVMQPAVGFKKHTYEIVSRLMRQKEHPSVLLMNNDDCAIAALAAIHDAGKRVPEDISIVGFDDLPIAQYLRPALTTIHQPGGDVGQQAFAMLHQMMQEPQASVAPVELNCQLVIRQSTGPVSHSK